jgi:uncharacterized damage-inducible protein DinB
MVCPICHGDHPDTDSRALAILASTPRRLEKLMSSVSPREAAARPAPGKWSAKEILSHLADTEVVYGFRYRKILAEPGSQLGEFDQEIWAKELHYRKQPLKTIQESFNALRRQNLALIKLMPKSAWSQCASHPEYGTISLREMLVHLATHDRNHAAQIERLTSALGKGTGRTKTARKKKRSRKVK